MNKLIFPDNNIFSELSRLEPNKKVVSKYWQNLHQIGMTITVWHEILYGLYAMPDGGRKQEIAKLVYRDLALLPKYYYDLECAKVHAQIRANCRAKGKTLSFADSQIASIALHHRAILVTRNVDDFCHVDGLMIENWFE